MDKQHRKAKITPENVQEAAKLRAIWDATPDKPNQAIFGDRFEIGSQSAVTLFLNGKTPLSLKAARGFAKGLRRDIAEFSTRLAAEAAKNMEFIHHPDDDEGFAMVKRADVVFSNGRGKLIFEEGAKAPLSFRRDYLRKLGISEKNAVVVDSDGRSNEPTIADGAVLLVNRSAQQIQNGKMYAFRYDGQLIVKRLHRIDEETVLAIPDNPDREAFPEQRYQDDGQDFELIGRVLWMAAEL